MKKKANNIISHLTDDGFDYDKTITDIVTDKKQYQAANDEENANVAWVIEHVVIVHKAFVESFHQLKARNYYKAWCNLEQIEILCNSIVKVCPGAFVALRYVLDTVHNIQLLYPYRLFTVLCLLIKSVSALYVEVKGL